MLRFSALLLSITFFLTPYSYAQSIENGVLDLRGDRWSNTVDLEGEWEFYWMEFIEPADERTSEYLMRVPSTWNNKTIDEKKLGPFGHASYRLKILVDPDHRLGIRTTIISTAFDLFINGEKVTSNGTPGTGKESSTPIYHPKTVPIENNGTLDVVLHVSNYHHRVGGIRDRMVIGDYETMAKIERNDLFVDFFIAGCFIMMGMYHVVLYLIKEDKSPLFFSIFCLIITVRLAVTGAIPITNFIVIPWEVLIRIEYQTFYLGGLAFIAFFNSLFKAYMNQKILTALVYFMGFMSLLVFILPTTVFTQLLLASQIPILIMTFYTMVVLWRAYKGGNNEVVIFVIGYSFLLLFFINDLLFVDELIETSHLFSAGLFLFLISQAVLLSRRYAHTFKQTEYLLQQLDSSNKILETKVKERTTILENQKRELQSSNDRIQLQNEELTKLNEELDNFVYSVSHDLKSPLASILGLIDLSKNEDDRATLQHYHALMEKSLNRQSEFISEILDYSRNARLKSSNEKINFEKMVHASLEQFQFIEDFEKITKSVIVNQNGDFVSDRQRISVVLNNLISNALKYSSVGTPNPSVTISIEADDKIASIQIEDNGCGIKEEKKEHVFEMFFRADDHKSGSGLGLYIVRESLAKLKGEIAIESTYGSGTKVTVHIPSSDD